MGLTGRGSDSSALTSQEEPQLKYSYRFRVEAKRQDAFDDEESKAEVQSYINELLGVSDKPRERTA
jgi:protoporphyrinogen oxidase